MKKTIVFATSNSNKVNEIKLLVPNEFEILSLKDINCIEEIPETASTIEGNAILKANYISQKYGYPCFADDSGLEVDALNGEPGVYSARYAGEEKDDNKNIDKLLQELAPHTNRKANFKTVIALNINNEQFLFTGIIDGEIILERKGSNGFGYDPIFKANGFDKTFAELTIEEKSLISHRGKAVKQLVEYLQNNNNL